MVRGNQRSMRQVSRGNPCDYRAMGQPESRCFLQHLRIFGIGLIRRNAETEMTVCRPHSTSNHYFISISNPYNRLERLCLLRSRQSFYIGTVFYILSILSFPYLDLTIGTLCRWNFICKGTASGLSPSTAALTVPVCSRQPSSNHRFGYSVPSRSLFTGLIVLSPLCILHKNHPDKKPRASRKGK